MLCFVCFRGLDMSPFTHPRFTTDRALYDLHAVCSHYGYMNFGHYIAYCKPYSEEELDTLALTNTDGKLADFVGVTIYTAAFHIIKHTNAFFLINKLNTYSLEAAILICILYLSSYIVLK